jgi:hypothetical protein
MSEAIIAPMSKPQHHHPEISRLYIPSSYISMNKGSKLGDPSFIRQSGKEKNR